MEMVTMNRKQLCCALLSLWTAQLLFAHDHEDKSGSVNSLDVCLTNGKEHLLIGAAAAGENKARLLYLSSTDNGRTWSAPVQVNAGMPAPHGQARGADAQIAASGDRLIAVWQTAGGDAYGAGPMATALSSDGGKTWRSGPQPADDNLNIGHGYVDITADEKGVFYVVWLDSRNGKQGLYYARSDDGGEHWSKNTTIDPETCECCWNAIAAHEGKVFVLYRRIDPRDMALTASTDGGKTWRKDSTVGAFDWHFKGCPEVGGNLAFRAGELYSVTWTGKPEMAGVYVWNSANGGLAWNSHKLGTPNARNPDIASRANEIAAAWEEGGKGIFVATSDDSGKTWATQRVAGAAEFATHPRLLGDLRNFRVFWTEMAGEKIVWKSAELPQVQSSQSQ
jgi:Neuraminidase (sialidase)